MKIFVSWSGELSCKIAEVLKKWIPCIVQSVDVFFSPEDIEKGNNWERILSTELSECKFGIICLTQENTSAPWLNFEAGAIAKTLDSKVAALMINIKPSDIKGPLSRYQATKLDKDDFYQLIVSINKTLEDPREESILKNVFDAMWAPFSTEMNQVIEEFASKSKSENNGANEEQVEGSPLEEILQLLRTQNNILSNPENIIPLEYMERLQAKISERYYDRDRGIRLGDEELMQQIINYLRLMIMRIQVYSDKKLVLNMLEMFCVREMVHFITRIASRGKSKQQYIELRSIDNELSDYVSRHHELLEI